MQLGYIGLGKMGKNMVLRLLEKGHEVVAWNRSPEPRQEVAEAGAMAVETVEELVQKLQTPRIVWLMLPAGEVTHQMIEQLSSLLSPGDILIDGSNNQYKQTVQHAELLHRHELHFFDAGISGGPAGARNGACVMVGGDVTALSSIEVLFHDIAAPGAYQFFGKAGAGHFVKMVHNGIEYGMMQAIAEGFEVLKKSDFGLDLVKVANLYNTGSVIESRLVGWVESGISKHGPELTNISSTVAHSGEGQWTVEAAQELSVAVPIISGSLEFRKQSSNQPSYTGKVLSMLRNEFGGHETSEKV